MERKERQKKPIGFWIFQIIVALARYKEKNKCVQNPMCY
jgi:hypothetical protein